MHNFVRCVLMCCTVAMLSGCGKNSIKTKTEKNEYSVPNGTATIETISVVSKNGKATNDVLQNISTQILDGFIEKSKTEKKVTLDVKSRQTYNDGKIINVLFEGEMIKDENKREKFRISKLIEAETGKILSIDDMFCDDEWKKYVDAEFEKVMEEKEYSELWEKPCISIWNEEDFYIENGKLVLYFPPYKLSYYKKGFVEFEFDIEKLNSFLRENLQKLHKKQR